jgi:hypothetical protein
MTFRSISADFVAAPADSVRVDGVLSSGNHLSPRALHSIKNT